ncbi:ABC transporter ATP-binding protein [uncultured Finegoldia sp.]|uniref:ABC transporter ATP-binding protein n=1 Tax=uncultured Finegoldia sp. TaxID=328009 RepID=UPI00263394B5|nr:ABC transporter ATP-binding protein [uncultured Finegoldia sp.]
MEKIFEIKNLKKYFPVKKQKVFEQQKYLKALDGIDLEIYKGETFGLVGESGSGKSTLGKCITRIHDITEGEVFFKGNDIKDKSTKTIMHNEIQAIFQDPYSSLNPTLTVYEIIAEPIKTRLKLSDSETKKKVEKLLEKVGLSKEIIDKKPGQFSGGQRQRIGIARAISTEPEFILCDEPISALDVSIQAQIVNLLEDLQNELGLTYLFIAHDLAMVQHISHRIGVLYLGNLVEVGNVEDIYENPIHPYTKELLNSVLKPEVNDKKILTYSNKEIPSPIDLPDGCPFQARCSYRKEICSQKRPELVEVSPGHKVSCHIVSSSKF